MNRGDNKGPGTTIVGGQPQARRSYSAYVPVGLEKVLYLAASDPLFKEELLKDRTMAAQARGLKLRHSEQAVLQSTPEAQLLAIINSLDVSSDNVGRRGFLRSVAASTAAVAAGANLGACGDDSDKNDQGVKADVHVGLDAGGIQPDTSYLKDGAGFDDTVKVDIAPPVDGVQPDTGFLKDGQGAGDTVQVDTGPSTKGILPDTGFLDGKK